VCQFEIQAPPGTGGVARSAGAVAKFKISPNYSYHPSRDPLRDPAVLLSQEDSLLILISNWPTTGNTPSIGAGAAGNRSLLLNLP
jgi:hypothetical protein